MFFILSPWKCFPLYMCAVMHWLVKTPLMSVGWLCLDSHPLPHPMSWSSSLSMELSSDTVWVHWAITVGGSLAYRTVPVYIPIVWSPRGHAWDCVYIFVWYVACWITTACTIYRFQLMVTGCTYNFSPNFRLKRYVFMSDSCILHI